LDKEQEVQYVITSFAVEFRVSKIVDGQPMPSGQVVINLPQNLYPTDLTPLIPNVLAQAEVTDKSNAGA